MGDVIEIKYANGKWGKINRIDRLYDLLIRQRQPVLFVGEGDFSFTVAFAALREHKRRRSSGEDCFATRHTVQPPPLPPLPTFQVWERIKSTRYEPKKCMVRYRSPVPKPPADVQKVKLACISNVIRYSLATGRITCKHFAIVVESILSLKRMCNFKIRYGVDARRIPPSLIPPAGGVVWFQCPWLGRDTGELIREFLLSTAHHLDGGSYVCVGITKHKSYSKRYELEDILGRHLKANSDSNDGDSTDGDSTDGDSTGGDSTDGDSTDGDSTDGDGTDSDSTRVLKKYRFLGADDKLIRMILHFGYHHCGLADIHWKIFDNHLTLVFQKIPLQSSDPMTSLCTAFSSTSCT